MVRSEESVQKPTAGETKDAQPIGYRLIAEMVNSSDRTEPHLDKFKDHQPECEAVQFKAPDKEVFINAAEQEAVSDAVGIFSHVTQDNALSDRLPSTELALESANAHEIDAALIEVLLEEKQANKTTKETEEHSTDIKNEPQDQTDLEHPVIKPLGDSGEVENRNKTTSSPEPQTSNKDQSFPNPYHEHSLDVIADCMLFQEAEENRMDPKARDDHPERISGTILEHLEETCFNSEIQLLATEETKSLEPLTKKRFRRRMGMCGLGDRKRKFPFDRHHCLTGGQKQEGALKGNKSVQHLYNTVLENGGTTPVDHEGTTRPACKEYEEVLKDNSGAAMTDDERTTGVAEKENRCAVEPMVLEHELNLLEALTTGVGQTLLSVSIGKNLNVILDESSIAAASKPHEMETTTYVDEPNFPGPDTINSGQDIEFNTVHDVVSEKQNLHADCKAAEDLGETATEVEVAQEVCSASACATVEMSKGSVVVTKVIQEVPTDLQENESELKEHCPSNMAAAEILDPNGPGLSWSTENGLLPLFVDNMDIAAMASSKKRNAKGHGENDVWNTAPAGGNTSRTKGISEPTVPPTGQENHMHVRSEVGIPLQNCHTSVTPPVAEYQVCNPTPTPATNQLPQGTCFGFSDPSLLYSITDSQLHKIALSMELEAQPIIPEGCDQQEDATELARGLIRELSFLNRTVMAAHREMELLRRGKLPKAPSRQACGPRPTEM